MDKLRISASDVDSYRWFRDDDEAELADFLADIRRQSEPTLPMLAGRAFHTALENATQGEFIRLGSDGFTFDFEIDGQIELPDVREHKVTREFIIGDCTVTLVGKVDAIHGLRIDDHKLTTRFDAERFFNSYQWRIYLLLFAADEFRWNIFEARDPKEKHYTIHALHPLRMHRYPNMREDVIRELERYVEFARTHLPERIAA